MGNSCGGPCCCFQNATTTGADGNYEYYFGIETGNSTYSTNNGFIVSDADDGATFPISSKQPTASDGWCNISIVFNSDYFNIRTIPVNNTRTAIATTNFDATLPCNYYSSAANVNNGFARDTNRPWTNLNIVKDMAQFGNPIDASCIDASFKYIRMYDYPVTYNDISNIIWSSPYWLG